MLADRDIAAHVSRGHITIDPPPPVERLQPVSIDVSLAATLRTFDDARYRVVRLSEIPDDLTTEVDAAGGFHLRPGEFVLGSTVEHITLPDDLCAFLHGKSTTGRLGLQVHSTAGLIDPGFTGHITLEISNIGELVLDLHPGDLIGQLTFEATSSPCLRPYGTRGLGSHYQHQVGPTPPRSTVRPVEELAPVVALRSATEHGR